MTFALISTSRGDDLIPPKTTVVAVGSKEKLEDLRDWRKAEREVWLETHSLPWWAEYSVISKEEVFALEQIQGEL